MSEFTSLVFIAMIVVMILAMIFFAANSAHSRRTDAYYAGYLYGQYGNQADCPKANWSRPEQESWLRGQAIGAAPVSREERVKEMAR